jgi:hypothetical protein
VKVALSLPEATPHAGELSLAIRGNVLGFQQAGHDVTVYYESDLPRLAGHTEEYDLVVLPYLDKTIDTGETHLHHEIGWFGPQDLDPRLVANTFEKSDSVSMSDPAMPEKAAWFGHLDVTVDHVAMIPSPPPLDLFPGQPREAGDGTVLIPTLRDEYAPDRRCAAIVRHTPMITYRAHSRNLDHGLPGNVRRYPPVPVSALPRRYGGVELVFNPAQIEALPSTCSRAFCSKRAYVSANEAIGALQTIPADAIDTDGFGASVGWWLGSYESSFFQGDHYFSPGTEGLPEVLEMVMGDRELRWEVAERGREWIETIFGEWGWQQKAETIVGLVDS